MIIEGLQFLNDQGSTWKLCILIEFKVTCIWSWLNWILNVYYRVLQYTRAIANIRNWIFQPNSVLEDCIYSLIFKRCKISTSLWIYHDMSRLPSNQLHILLFTVAVHFQCRHQEVHVTSETTRPQFLSSWRTDFNQETTCGKVRIYWS